MNVTRFVARDAAEAVGKIRSELGPDAVVLTVNQIPPQGLVRLWRKPRLEIFASSPEPKSTGGRLDCTDERPEETPVKDHRNDARAAAVVSPARHESVRKQRRETLSAPGEANQSLRAATTALPAVNARKWSSEYSIPLYDLPEDEVAVAAESIVADPNADPGDSGPPHLGGSWRSGAVLYQMGLQPLHVEKVLERVRSRHGNNPPGSFAREMALVHSALTSFWRPLTRKNHGRTPMHVFVGPSGSGKTTALCKWMAKSVLAGTRNKVRAWRLDSRSANFAGLLDVYGEILSVPIEREWTADRETHDFDIGFVDLPGVDPANATAIRELRARIEAIPGAEVHLVLNAAYDVPVILAQARAFSALPVSDVIFTHLDEEKRRGKLWNFVLGTNFTVRFLAGGQNIPGNFLAAEPGLLFSRQFHN